jgi:hypothetical protein
MSSWERSPLPSPDAGVEAIIAHDTALDAMDPRGEDIVVRYC